MDIHFYNEKCKEKTIRSRFGYFKYKNNDSLGHVIVFNLAVACQDFPSHLITRWFRRLVDKNDYPIEEERSIVNHAKRLSLPCEFCKQTDQKK